MHPRSGHIRNDVCGWLAWTQYQTFWNKEGNKRNCIKCFNIFCGSTSMICLNNLKNLKCLSINGYFHSPGLLLYRCNHSFAVKRRLYSNTDLTNLSTVRTVSVGGRQTVLTSMSIVKASSNLTTVTHMLILDILNHLCNTISTVFDASRSSTYDTVLYQLL